MVCTLSEPHHVSKCCQNQGVQNFFSHQSGHAAFFTKSAKRTKLLDEICQRRLPRVTPTLWNFSSRLVCTVYKQKELLELFEFIVDKHSDFDDDVHSADGYTALLMDFEFCFLLATFNSVFAYSDVLFGILQSKEYDMQFCSSSIEDFCSITEKEKAKSDSIYEDIVRKVGVPSRRRARRVGECTRRTSSCTVKSWITFSLS